MSNRQLKTTDVRFDPVSERLPRSPSDWTFVLGVAYPATVLAIELLSRICARSFFDPMPTVWHALAVGFVPASNLLLWIHLEHGKPQAIKWLAAANGAAIAIAGFYTLLFLPLLPLAIVGIVVGIGLLPLAPLASFVAALRLRKALRAGHRDEPLNRATLGGLAVGLTLLLAFDAQSAATRLGIQWAASGVPAERERGLRLLHAVGDDDLLLRLCYGTAGRSSGLLSTLVMFSDPNWTPWTPPRQRQPSISPADAREVYYRLHGVPFNARPAPFESGQLSRLADFQFDDDHGGTQVGGRLKGLYLASSRIDGSVSGDDLVAYLEWTIEFRNTETVAREARLQIALPPGGVVSRATLWVNGEEREAAYGGRGEVRAAYQRVAVQQRRDPLLVTTKGADRVLAQAFPVPPNGGTIKFKIGMSAPLDVTDATGARLTLPALVDRNFSFASDMRHGVWIESRQALAAAGAGLNASRVHDGLFRITGALADRDLARPRPAVTVSRSPDAGSRTARVGEGELVVQEITRGAPPAMGALLLVVDGSARLADTRARLMAALNAVAPGTKVGAIIAADPLRRLPLAPWSGTHKQAVMGLLRSTTFDGGQDNAPALAEAMQMLEAEPQATLLWVHGPQPVSFRAGAARLEQASARLSRLPNVVLYSVEPGPNELLPDAPWAWAARSLPQSGSLQTDLAEFLAGRAYTIRRAQADVADGPATGSDHIARLWASERVLELMRKDQVVNRSAALELATRYRLVTPVSGAVVLESQQQYDESRLTPVSKTTVPTIPEPHEWALALLACALLAWFAWRNRQRFAVA